MHGVCGYSVVQFLFQRLETGEKNIPIYDLVLSLTAGREGGGGGQGKRAKTPGFATERKEAYLDLTADVFWVKDKRFDSDGSRIFIGDLIIYKDMQIEGLSSPGDRTCILQILIPATVNFI